MRKFLILIILLFVLCTGCTNISASEYSYGNSYPAVVAWNYVVYGLSVETVPLEEIDLEIGQVKHAIISVPEKNGDSNIAPVGSKLYKIKNTSHQNAIVVKIDGQYFKAYKNGTLY